MWLITWWVVWNERDLLVLLNRMYITCMVKGHFCIFDMSSNLHISFFFNRESNNDFVAWTICPLLSLR